MRKSEEVAFNQWFTPGSTTGYLVEMKLLDGARQPSAARGFRTRGIAAYTFTTTRFEEVARRWHVFNGSPAPVYEGDLPSLGRTRAFMVRSPDGIPFEVVEQHPEAGE